MTRGPQASEEEREAAQRVLKNLGSPVRGQIKDNNPSPPYSLYRARAASCLLIAAVFFLVLFLQFFFVAVEVLLWGVRGACARAWNRAWMVHRDPRIALILRVRAH
eukprot:1380108-Rhodomonas_salina.1